MYRRPGGQYLVAAINRLNKQLTVDSEKFLHTDSCQDLFRRGFDAICDYYYRGTTCQL